MKKNDRLPVRLVWLSWLALTACGGGGGGSSPAPATDNAAGSQTPAPSPAVVPAPTPAVAPAPALTPAPSPAPSPAPAGAATVAGAITTPYPTLTNLTVEWAITGDDNLNGVVSVRYRQQGASVWQTGMPLRRIAAGTSAYAGVSWLSRHSGSVLDLQPGTTYEIELSLNDPDGGSVTRTVTATTRAVPVPMAGAPVKAVTPSSFASVAASAKPGDILDLAAGIYAGFNWAIDGTAAKPIVIRSTAGAVINGGIDLQNRTYVYLDGLTLDDGRVRIDGSSGVAVMRCHITRKQALSYLDDGIASYNRSENSYIADNVILGATAWPGTKLGVGATDGEGIRLTGPGHVIIYNKVSGFHDNISFQEQGDAVEQFSIDVMNNDISEAGDDAIEADSCFHNCRIMRNRITNAFMGVSSQPSLGGPTYIVRNVMYNIFADAFKLNNGSVGNVVLHNTVVKNGDALSIRSGAPISATWFRNNLAIGGGPGVTFGEWNTGSGRVLAIADLVIADSTIDYDALGSVLGTFSGTLGGNIATAYPFSSLAQLRATPMEHHVVQVDLNSFSAAVAFPSAPLTQYTPPDMRLKAGSPAVDAGERIPNINDGYSGSAPDIGAYEWGATPPHYGPR